MIHTDFQSNLVPAYNEKQNPEESYTKNIMNMLLAVIALNLYVLMISLVMLLSHS